MEIIINSTNNYSKKNVLHNRLHNKYLRKSLFKETNKKGIQKFFGICLLMGSFKFSVLRDAFSSNPLYYHPIIKMTMSERRFEQLLNGFNVEYSGINVSDNGPMRKIKLVFNILIDNFRKAYYPDNC